MLSASCGSYVSLFSKPLHCCLDLSLVYTTQWPVCAPWAEVSLLVQFSNFLLWIVKSFISDPRVSCLLLASMKQDSLLAYKYGKISDLLHFWTLTCTHKTLSPRSLGQALTPDPLYQALNPIFPSAKYRFPTYAASYYLPIHPPEANSTLIALEPTSYFLLQRLSSNLSLKRLSWSLLPEIKLGPLPPKDKSKLMPWATRFPNSPSKGQVPISASESKFPLSPEMKSPIFTADAKSQLLQVVTKTV